MAVDFDFSDFLKLADSLNEAAGKALEAAKPVVAKGAMNVKQSMRDDMAASAHFGQVARSISYDTRSGATFVEAEVGPITKGKTVGDLAHFAYFGGAHGGGNTVRDPQGNLDDEAPKFLAALGDALGKVLDD
jgi:hypothetical protein